MVATPTGTPTAGSIRATSAALATFGAAGRIPGLAVARGVERTVRGYRDFFDRMLGA